MTIYNFANMACQWFSEYCVRRYLRYLPDEILHERLQKIASNMWSTDRNGEVIAPRSQHNRIILIRLYFETKSEIIIRSGNRSSFSFDERAIRETASAAYNTPALDSPINFDLQCYSKYGRRDHLEASFDRGIFRIAPASSYDDPSLNSAQADRELEHFSRDPNLQLMFSLRMVDEAGNEIPDNAERLETFQYMMVPDYYVWCCGIGFDYRMYGDFQADTALIIHDRDQFQDRLNDAVTAAISVTSHQATVLEYYDPFNVERSQLRPGISKQFSYLYQNEFRFIWNTDLQEQPLNPFMVELGSIRDISSICSLIG